MLSLFTVVMITGLVIVTNQKKINSRLWEIPQPKERLHKTIMLSHRLNRVHGLYLTMLKEKNEQKQKQALYLIGMIENRLAQLNYKDIYKYN